MWIERDDTKERMISMYKKIITEEEIKFNNSEKRYLNLYVVLDA